MTPQRRQHVQHCTRSTACCDSETTDVQSTIPGNAQKNDPADRYYEWSWKRYQQRILRLTLALVLLVALATIVIAMLSLRIRDLETTHANDISRIGDLERRVEVLYQRPTNDGTQKTELCLNNAIQHLNDGLRRMLSQDLTPRAYLARYKIPRCS